MYEFIKNLCNKMCHNYFENSKNSCISNINVQERLLLLMKPSTVLKVDITRKIQNFCRINQNRFWLIYYRISESKIHFKCQKCNKSNLCQDYILSKIMKYLKSFNPEEESIVFKTVRENLIKIDTLYKKNHLKLEKIKINIEKNNTTPEVIHYYTKKIIKEYQEKAFDFNTGLALIENVLVNFEENEIKNRIEHRLNRYRVYQSPIILNDLISQSLNYNEKEDLKLLSPILIELLHKEKFINYIKKPIESRFIDFVRSKQYNAEIIEDIEPQNPIESDDYIEIILKGLSSDEKIIYKLKYGVILDNREFLTVTHHLNYKESDLIDELIPEELFYIKFSIHYKLHDNSEHFSMLSDIENIKESITKKISNYRKKIKSHSYKENHGEEILIKLIYSEPLSAKEIGIIFKLTDKQIGKKVENIKKKLEKRLEQKS